MGFLKRSIVFAVSVLVCCYADDSSTTAADGSTTAADGSTTAGNSSATVSCTKTDDQMWRSLDDKTVTADDTADAKQLVLCLASEFVHAASGKGVDVDNMDFKVVVTECGGPDLTDVDLSGLDLTADKPTLPESTTIELGDVDFVGTDVAKCIEHVESLEDDAVLDDAAVEPRLVVAFGVALSSIFLS